MCRICTYVGKVDREIINEICETMLKVSRHDTIGILSGIDDYHPDGWGIYATCRDVELYFRSSKPIYEDEDTFKNIVKTLCKFEKLLTIMHIRAASEGEPIGFEHSHPYMIDFGNVKVVLAHNGAVKKIDILDSIGMPYLKDYVTDSKALSIYIAYMLNKGKNIDDIIIEIMEKYTKTALMTSIYIRDLNSRKLVITSHITERARRRESYYRLYKVIGDEFTIYMSSSLVYNSHIECLKVSKYNTIQLPSRYYYEIINIDL